MRIKALLATAVLAMGGFTGNATAQDGGVFLTVYDPVRLETYNVNLGITYLDIIAALDDPDRGASALSFGPDAGLASWIAGAGNTADLVFDVAADGTYSFDPAVVPANQWGAMVTADQAPNPLVGFSGFGAVGQNIASYFGGVLASIAGNNSIAAQGFGPGYWGDVQWNGTIGTQIAGATTGGPLNTPFSLFWLVDQSGLYGSDTDNPTQVIELGSFTVGLDGSLTFTPVIPIPAAGWLLISALGGLIGVARRRRLA